MQNYGFSAEKRRGIQSQGKIIARYAFGNKIVKVAPLPNSPVAFILPPWFSATFRHIAKPIPVPGYSLRPCKRWKIVNIRSPYFGSNPMPLSWMEIIWNLVVEINPNSLRTSSGVARWHLILIIGFSFTLENFKALLKIFWNNCINWLWSPSRVGNKSICISVFGLAILSSILVSTSPITAFKSIFWNGLLTLDTLEKLSRSSISTCMRVDAPLIRFRKSTPSSPSWALYFISKRSPKACIFRNGSCRSCDAT